MVPLWLLFVLSLGSSPLQVSPCQLRNRTNVSLGIWLDHRASGVDSVAVRQRRRLKLAWTRSGDVYPVFNDELCARAAQALDVVFPATTHRGHPIHLYRLGQAFVVDDPFEATPDGYRAIVFFSSTWRPLGIAEPWLPAPTAEAFPLAPPLE